MKKRKLFAMVLCGLLALGAVGGAAGCASSGESVTSEQSEPEAVNSSEVMSGTEEEMPENMVLFHGDLNYASEKDDKLDCSVVLTALEGTFAEKVAAEDIVLGGGFQEASDVKILENTKDSLEIGFMMPKNDLDVETLSIDGSVQVKEGVMLDAEGKPAGVTVESVYTLPSFDKGLANVEDYSDVTITLSHKGAYVAEFYVYWYQFKGLTENGYADYESVAWEGNGKRRTAGYKTTISIKDAGIVYVDGYGYTGFSMRNPLSSRIDSDVFKSSKNLKFTLKGTSLHQSATIELPNGSESNNS